MGVMGVMDFGFMTEDLSLTLYFSITKRKPQPQLSS